jgi:hypothetical protein
MISVLAASVLECGFEPSRVKPNSFNYIGRVRGFINNLNEALMVNF